MSSIHRLRIDHPLARGRSKTQKGPSHVGFLRVILHATMVATIALRHFRNIRLNGETVLAHLDIGCI
jgi:hypothetical protein